MKHKKRKLRLDRVFKATVVFFIVVAVITLAVRVCYNTTLKLTHPTEYSEHIEKYSEENNIDKALLYAVIRNESGFDCEAVSSVNARGLTQITQDTFDWLMTKTGENLSHEALFDPETSVRYGALFLGILTEEFEVTETAVAAYHAGLNQVRSWLGDSMYSKDGKTLDNIPFDDTRQYVKKVMRSIEIYKDVYNF